MCSHIIILGQSRRLAGSSSGIYLKCCEAQWAATQLRPCILDSSSSQARAAPVLSSPGIFIPDLLSSQYYPRKCYCWKYQNPCMSALQKRCMVTSIKLLNALHLNWHIHNMLHVVILHSVWYFLRVRDCPEHRSCFNSVNPHPCLIK